MNIRKLIIGLVAIAGIYFLYDALSQPNPSDLEGNFRETATYRNANNTGPVVRIYAVTADDTLWNEARLYGDMMPYTKYGTTTVYYFKGNRAPQTLSPQPPFFDAAFAPVCFARYHKDAMGFVSVQRFPFGKSLPE